MLEEQTRKYPYLTTTSSEAVLTVTELNFLPEGVLFSGCFLTEFGILIQLYFLEKHWEIFLIIGFKSKFWKDD